VSEPNVELWREHWRDEGDAAYLYRALADSEPDANRAGIFRRLAEVEDRHVRLWREVLEEHGERVGDPRPSLRARTLGWLGRRFGPRVLLPLLLAEEGREMKGYLGEYRSAPGGTPGATALRLARESAQHAETLGALSGRVGEPWHRTESGGFLRNVVYGFNDGLTANFGLVMGVVGAAVPHPIIVISGVAGCVADALSMGSSGYLAAKSEREVYAHEIAVEREEIRLMPELEEEELALLYEAKGFEPEAARAAAAAVMKEPERALAEKAREELGITEAAMSPLREGWVTGVATAFGALIPIVPFLAFSGRAAVWTSFAISMCSHFGVGAARSVFTGRGVIRSGFDMFVVGLGVALVGYVVGTWITEWL
jgi:VIT1/CCC1 family predicted Fe2+/Mn2+ transporter